MKRMLRKLKHAFGMNLFQFVYYNFFCRQVERRGAVYIFPYWGTHISIAKSAKIILKANLILNGNKLPGSKAETLVLLREGAKWSINGDVLLYYGDTLQVHKDAQLVTGDLRMNTGSTLICAYKMTIGQKVSAAREVFIFDSDHHPVYNADNVRINEAKEVVIGDNVWIGLKSIVMKGSHIESGTVISAHSLVSGSIPGHCLVASAPARPVMKDIHWER